MKKKKTVYFKKKTGYVLLSMVGILTVGVLQADQLVHKYSTLAKDISESLFNYSGIPTAENPIAGEINLEGNVLKWINDGVTITLIIEEWFDGVLISTTEIVIPVGSFGGCWIDCDG